MVNSFQDKMKLWQTKQHRFYSLCEAEWYIQVTQKQGSHFIKVNLKIIFSDHLHIAPSIRVFFSWKCRYFYTIAFIMMKLKDHLSYRAIFTSKSGFENRLSNLTLYLHSVLWCFWNPNTLWKTSFTHFCQSLWTRIDCQPTPGDIYI